MRRWPFTVLPILATTASLALFAPTAWADVRLPRIFGDHMVVQRDQPLVVWGFADAGEKVEVTLAGAKASATTAKSGAWKVTLPAFQASADGRPLVVAGKNSVTVNDVLVGDVWLCSGQSNMEWGVGGCDEDLSKLEAATIRCIKFGYVMATEPQEDVPAEHVAHPWLAATAQTVGMFPAVGFFFAKRVQQDVAVPMGLVNVAWGGTNIEPWLDPDGFAAITELAEFRAAKLAEQQADLNALVPQIDRFEQWARAARTAMAKGVVPPATPPAPSFPILNRTPFSIYFAKVAPLAPMALKGVLWYQGESNGDEGESYFHKMRALVGGWRKVFRQPELPFYSVQLANWQQPNEAPAGGDGWARIRCEQTKSLSIPRTGMCVTIDAGDANDIHPHDKRVVGERLARWALRDCYGQKQLVVSGPLFRSVVAKGALLVIDFDHVGAGLMAGQRSGRGDAKEQTDGKLARFAIAGADKVWHWADARIDGEHVVVSAPDVPAPVAVRYAFSMNPVGANLYNRDGLPASPFRSDDW